MKVPWASQVRFASVALVLGGLIASPVLAQQETPAATRQYSAAAKLQNLESYDLAADAWAGFVKDFPKDTRVAEAYYHLGVCCYQVDRLKPALAAFEKAAPLLGEGDLAESSLLYLGVTQLEIGKSGQRELLTAAAGAFQDLHDKYPEGQYRGDALYYQGECAYLLGKLDEAAKLYGSFVATYPNHRLKAEALYALGVTQDDLNQAEAAAKTHERFLADFPKHHLAPEVAMRCGESLLLAGRFSEAAARFSTAAAAPGFEMADSATFRLAESFAQMKQHSRAADLYASVISKYPQSNHVAEATLAGGKCYYLAGDFGKAVELLNRVPQGEGDAPVEAAHWIARSLLKQSQPAEALAVIEKAIPSAGKSHFLPELLMDRADAVYEMPPRRAESIGLFAAVAQKHPGHPLAADALYMATFASLQEDQYEEALRHSKAFLAKHADHRLAADVSNLAAESNLQLGNAAEAQRLFALIIQKYPDHPDRFLWRIRRAVALGLEKKHQAAIAAIEPVLSEIREPELAAEAHYILGSNRLQLKEYPVAVDSLLASLAAKPKWRKADQTYLDLARAYHASGDAKRAAAAVARVIAEFPDSQSLDRAYYRLGEYRYALGDYDKAAEAHGELIERFPKSSLVPSALHELGCAQLNRNDAAGAEKTLDRLVTEYADSDLIVPARYARGMARRLAKKYDLAIADLNAVLASDSDSHRSDAQYVLGLCYLGLEKHADAAGAFETLLASDPAYVGADDAYYQWAWALSLGGESAEAARKFALLAEKFPQSKLAAEAQHHVGEFHYRRQDYQRAAVAYYAAMRAAAGTSLGEKAGYRLGWSYYHQDNFSDAEKTFDYQLATYPDGETAAEAAFARAECRFKQEKFKEALQAYAAVEGLTNPDFQALLPMHAGQSAGQLKLWKESLEWLEKCSGEFPDSKHVPQALYEQGWARQNMNQADEAVELYKDVIARTDQDVAARAQFMIGEIEFAQEKHKEAVKSFFVVVYGYGSPKWRAEAAFEAARCFEVLGKKTQAVKMYRELIELFPASDKAILAGERLKELQP
jgi:TolA-binding protein